MNGREQDIELAGLGDNSYLLTDSGEKLLLVKSPTNADLTVPAGKVMDGALVFAGKLPSSGNVSLVLNATDTADNVYSARPRFEAVLPLDSAGMGSVPETSSLSNMRGLPVSRFGPAASAAGELVGTANNATNDHAIEKLKSGLGAVGEGQGTVVSLPAT